MIVQSGLKTLIYAIIILFVPLIVVSSFPRYYYLFNLMPWIQQEVWSVLLPFKISRSKYYLKASLSAEEQNSNFLFSLIESRIKIDWNENNNNFLLCLMATKIFSSAQGRLTTDKDGTTLVQLRFGPNLWEQIMSYFFLIVAILVFILSPAYLGGATLFFGCMSLALSYLHLVWGTHMIKEKCKEAIPLTNIIDLMMPLSEEEMRLYEKLRPLHWVKGNVIRKITQNETETSQ